MVRTTGANQNNGTSSTSGSGGSPPNRRQQQQQQPQSSKQLAPTPPSPVRARVRIVPEIYNDYNQIGLKQVCDHTIIWAGLELA